MPNSEKIQLERQAEIDVGYDQMFERQWGRFERWIWLGFITVIILGLLGYFGRGPMNTVKRTVSDGTMVQYERVVRFKTPTMIVFSIPVNHGLASIKADKTTVQKLGLQQVFPQPTESLGSEEIGPLEFKVAEPTAKAVLVQLLMQPSSVGPAKSIYQVNGETIVNIKQFIVP
jgi:hypothetical protein